MLLYLVIVSAFIIWFSSIWISVLSLLSFIGGWKKLSRLYPLNDSDRDGSLVKYKMCSIRLGFVSYRSVAVISFTDIGIILEVMKIFSVMHSPIFLPYSKMADVQKKKSFFDYTEFMIENKKIIFYGKAGDELSSRFNIV